MVLKIGDCYRTHGKAMVDDFEGKYKKLVHGFPILRVEPWAKYGHAWLEDEKKNNGYRRAKREAALSVDRQGPLAKTLIRGEDIWINSNSPRDG